MTIWRSIFGMAFSLSILALGACGGSQAGTGDFDDEASGGAELQAAFPSQTLKVTKIWRVKANGLNCRERAGTSAPIVFTFNSGTVLDVVPGTPRPVLNGFTWIKVNPRGDIDHNECFVAADDRFILPANNIDADNYSQNVLFQTKVLRVKTALNCREFPSKTSAIVFEAMPTGTILDTVPETGSDLPFVQWSDDSYWVHVNPRGDADHNNCWVSAKKSNVTIVL